MKCWCGCGQDAHDRHHALIGRRKGFPVLDDERNLVPVNHFEHVARKFDNTEWRIKFYKMLVQKHGKPAMDEWIEQVRQTKLSKDRLAFLKGIE